MSDSSSRQARTRDLDRFLTFVDAIVAIAVTLLVLPLVDFVRELDNGGSVRHLLAAHEAPIGAFVLSFAVISRLWLVQHRLMSHVVMANGALTLVLIMWSLTIVTIPFPTALIAAPGAGDQTATKIFYVGLMALSSFLLSVVSLLVARNERLRDSPQTPDVVRAFGTSGAFLVALGIMLIAPATTYWPLLILTVSDRVIAFGKKLFDRDVAGRQSSALPSS